MTHIPKNPIQIEQYNLARTQYDEYVKLVKESKLSLRATYNKLTKHGVEVFVLGDYRVLVEVEVDYKCVLVSFWFEPDDFSNRCKIEGTKIHQN